MGDVVKGIDECYVCGKSIEWEADMPVQKEVMFVRKLPEMTEGDLPRFHLFVFKTMRFTDDAM